MIGNKILNYHVTRLIGEGGMATVYEAVHDKLDTKVAIKVLNPVLTANANIRQRFLQEARMIASLNHPNIVKVIDFEERSDLLAIVMEYLDGSDLSDYIKKNGKLPVGDAVRLFIKVLDSFSYAHSKGIVHRDVKPSNIFLVGNFEPKILDFGIAKLIETDASLTHTGTQMGTPVYMSPELVNADKNIDHRSDIYSLGVTLFYILQGKPPYDATTISNFQIFNKIYTEPLPLLNEIPAVFNEIIQKATAKNPSDRFQSCDDFKSVLESLEIGQDKDKPHQKPRDVKTSPKANVPTIRFEDEKTLIEEVPAIPEKEKKVVDPVKKAKADAPAILAKREKKPKEPVERKKSKLVYYLIVAFVVVLLGIFAVMKFAGGPSAAEIAEMKRLDSITKADSIAALNIKLKNDSIANAENLKQAATQKQAADSLEQVKASAIVWTDKKHGSFTDIRDGQKYNVVKIGGQIWMAQNFNLATESGSWCYDSNPSNCQTYGRLYNWETARKSAPLGWHLPTKGEQETLIQDLYEKYSESLFSEITTDGEVGFDAPMAGQLDENNQFGAVGDCAYYWSSSPSANYKTWAYYIELNGYKKDVFYTSGERKCGYSVRYVKD